jgi:hypothetical protein
MKFSRSDFEMQRFESRALLNNERRNEFQRGGAVIDADVDLASIKNASPGL